MHKSPPQHKKKRTRNYTESWQKTPGRLLGTLLIRFYQITLSSFIGNQCRHRPTCSEYTYEAIARHGLWAGAWMGFFRLIRCGPFGTHGFDPVPTSLENSCRFYKPWCYWKISAKQNK
ncbi:putative membrane protein insertion efficiency factor [Bartonella silvatica]|uniref:Putative membrane protein insertion efficiency factor n=1 Tax=Bartonella silvatica TaxID=357760 RepID=A0ABV2HIR4_9HYPH